jgi:lysosomal acid lipase/cholesteryl ester hydrolase
MYDDDVQPPLSLGSVSKYTKVAKFPTRNIKTPIVLVYGGSDSLVDINVMLKELPAHTVATEIPHYEHLDFLWAREVDTLVFPHVFDALESFSDAEHSKEEYDRYRSARHASLAGGMRRPLPDSYLSEDDGSISYADVASVPPGSEAHALVSPNTTVSDASSTRKRTRGQEYDDSSDSAPANPTHIRTIPEGEVGINGNGNTAAGHLRSIRSGSIGSIGSIGSNLNFQGKGGRGISIGVGKAVSGVVKGETVGNITTSSDDGAVGSSPIGRKRGKR